MKIFLRISLLLWYLLYSYITDAQILTQETFSGGQTGFLLASDGVITNKNTKVDVDKNSYNKVFVWEELDATGSSDKNIRCAVYSESMSLLASFIVNKTTTGDQIDPIVKVNQQDNSFVVAWSGWTNKSNPNDPNKYDIFVKKIRFSNMSGDAANPDLLVNTAYISGRQRNPLLAFDYFRKEVMVAWVDYDGQDIGTTETPNIGSYATRIKIYETNLGFIPTPQFRLNDVTAGDQKVTSIEVAQSNGDFYTVCESQNYSSSTSTDIVFRKFSRLYEYHFGPGSTETIINNYLTGNQSQPEITMNSASENYIISWTSNAQDGDQGGIYMKVYDKSGTVLKNETKVNQSNSGNQIRPSAIWEENFNTIIVFYQSIESSMVNLKYQALDGTYNYLGSETNTLLTNANISGTFDVAYDKSSKRVLFALNPSTGNAQFKQFIFTPPATCTTGATSDQNYVEEQIITVSGVLNEATCNTLTESSIKKTRSYVDGIGRPLQNVTIKGSPSKRDLVKPFEYDISGRVTKEYLPYASGCGDGAFKDDFSTAQTSFYSNSANLNSDKVVNDIKPYSIIQYDNSPLNRVTKSFGPGNAWQTSPVDHSIRTTERTNAANEVRHWLFNPAALTANGTAFYPAGTLNVSQHIDEDNNISWTYTDFNGRIVLKTHYNAETYYVYDDFGNLRFVISPEGTSRLSEVNFVIGYTGDFTDKWLYTYEYDGRHRIIEKKIPGKAVEYLIYDSRDRLVMSQDGMQRTNNKWTFNKYDIHNRIVINGIFTPPMVMGRGGMQAAFSGSNPILDEKRETGTTHGYSSNVWPYDPICEILLVNYYDDYDFDYNGSSDHSYSVQGLTNEASVNKYVNGLSTGSKIRILGTSNWLKVVNFYDNQNRLIQVQKNNHKNLSSLSEIETKVYDFSGNIIQNYLKHNPGTGIMTVSTRFLYDHQGRLLKTWQKINSEPEVLINQLNYNELGQVIEKNLHSEDNGANYLQSVDYTYNIRGRQTNINGITLTNDGIINNDNNDLFGMTFDYESFYFNGNLSSFGWKSSNINTSQNIFAYSLMYDNLNRLWGAGSFEWTSEGTPISIGKFSEDRISYDKNGNILNLRRRLGAGTIDSLEYKYNGNKLESCKDFKNASLGFKDGSNTQIEYTYDANGNMISDANKGITSITYNHLNLPQVVTFTAPGNRIEYTYSAIGQKLSKKYFTSNVLQVTTDYISGLVYENNILKCGKTIEGRFEPNGAGGYKYVYDFKDHLGNVHMSFDKGPDGTARIVQEDHYYPFGMTINSPQFSYRFSTPNDFLYNGKEREEELGFELYDFGARFYDPALGRWHAIDPLAELSRRWNPYSYCYNNPMRFIDPDGMLPGDWVEKDWAKPLMTTVEVTGGGGGDKDKDKNQNNNNSIPLGQDLNDYLPGGKKSGTESNNSNSTSPESEGGSDKVVEVIAKTNSVAGVAAGAAEIGSTAHIVKKSSDFLNASKSFKTTVKMLDATDSNPLLATSLLKGSTISNISKFSNTVAKEFTYLSIGISAVNLMSGNGTAWDVVDIGVNTLGLVVATSNPVGLTIAGGVLLYNTYRTYQALTEQ